MGELLSGSVRREAAPFARNSRLLDPCRNTVKTNRSPFIDRCPKAAMPDVDLAEPVILDRKSTRLNSSHLGISYAVFCLKKKKTKKNKQTNNIKHQNISTI